MTTELFIQILWPDELEPDDLTIIHPATSDQPGQVRLQRASTGTARAGAPNSLPLLSHTGAAIGYVANTKHLEGPYEETYVIE
ncbi:MAG TPA: hypothetical protein ENH62_17495 [Marinobacter sp.]|uniref:Uncharacterized protein n=1 Tax=marine sediment metagenome TaxID=412755 RepID=A0A0F9NBV4_9ZZZZ|nr:hypothetical protein [Marinobacter sp.]